jgi:hypothetical protein
VTALLPFILNGRSASRVRLKREQGGSRAARS